MLAEVCWQSLAGILPACAENFSVAAVQLPTVDIFKPSPLYQKPTMTKSPPEARRVRFKGIANACKASEVWFKASLNAEASTREGPLNRGLL